MKNLNKILRGINSFDNLPEPKLENQESFETIMETAAYYLSKGIYTDWKEAIISACRAYKLNLALRAGVVSFTFRKSNGELRDATGTLSNDYFSYEAKGSGRTKKFDLITYYDLDKEAWRCARIERITSFTNSMEAAA